MTPEEKVALLKEARVWDVIGFPGCIDKLIDLVAAHEREKQAEQEPAELKKCRHCGFLCAPNPNESKRWYPLEQAGHEPFDMDDHPPHRLCECRKCMEYFTPLPDCDAFAASGKPIAEQTNTQFMEGYRIGLAEMREKCAKVVTKHAPTTSPHWVSYVAAIRAIKFEGDTGFRPVSEMIAEHKQDPKKAAAIEKAKMRKAKQEPIRFIWNGEGWIEADDYIWKTTDDHERRILYAAPVRTKDLTDDEIAEACGWKFGQPMYEWVIGLSRAVIAAFKEKNK